MYRYSILVNFRDVAWMERFRGCKRAVIQEIIVDQLSELEVDRMYTDTPGNIETEQ